MGVDLLDIVFRLGRTFHVEISRAEFIALFDRNGPSDITAGNLFALVRSKAIRTDAFDEDLDAEVLWLMFRRAISDSLGVDCEEVTRDRRLIRELGAT